jgi:hypothetical protein
MDDNTPIALRVPEPWLCLAMICLAMISRRWRRLPDSPMMGDGDHESLEPYLSAVAAGSSSDFRQTSPVHNQ